jgi:hypothetical protein
MGIDGERGVRGRVFGHVVHEAVEELGGRVEVEQAHFVAFFLLCFEL